MYIFRTFVFLLFLLNEAGAQTRLQAALDKLAAQPALKGATISWCFREVQSGKMLAARNEHQLLLPASTAKLYTAVAALDILQPGFRYSTRFYLTELEGDLLVTGSGDPSFGHEQPDSVFEKVRLSLKRFGVDRLRGGITVDPHCFPYNQYVLPRDRTWEDMGNYYGAGVFGLNWRNNSYALTFTVTGDSVGVSGGGGMAVRNGVKPVASGKAEEIYLYAAPFSGEVYTGGTLLTKQGTKTERGSLADPPRAFAAGLQQHLNAAGIETGAAFRISSQKTEPAGNRRLLTTLESPPLAELLREVNQKSNNLYAEALARTAGMQLGADGTAEDACKKLRSYLVKKMQTGDSLFVLRDGSGLSRNNLVTTAGQTALLHYAARQTWFPAFEQSLAEPGISGTMKVFPLIKGVKAKTGHVRGVRACSGYLTDASGKRIAFSIIINNLLQEEPKIREWVAEVLEAAVGR